MCIVSAETVLPALATLAVFAALLAMLKLLKNRGLAFTPRVFTALGLGIALGVGVQLALGRGSDAALWALDWIAVVGQGYIALLKMLVMPLVFVAIVGAFTRTKVTENLGRISVVVLAVLLGTVAVAALVGWAGAAFTGLAGASFTADAGSDAAAAAAASALQDSEQQVADLTLPQEILSFIPSNVFADFAGSTSHVHHRRRHLLRHRRRGLPALARPRLRTGGVLPAARGQPLRHRHAHRGHGAGTRALWRAGAHRARHGLERLPRGARPGQIRARVVRGHRVHVRRARTGAAGEPCEPAALPAQKAFPVLSFAFVARSSAGALPLNIETQTNALGVDEATANFAASFGMSIGQNGCAGIYPAMLATIIAPTVGIDVFSPAFVAGLVAVVVISSFGVAGVGGGATFASLIVLGTMGLPLEIVGLLASVEPLIDMGRTALNVSDSMVAGVTASNAAGTLDRTVYNDPEARVSTGMHTEL